MGVSPIAFNLDESTSIVRDDLYLYKWLFFVLFTYARLCGMYAGEIPTGMFGMSRACSICTLALLIFYTSRALTRVHTAHSPKKELGNIPIIPINLQLYSPSNSPHILFSSFLSFFFLACKKEWTKAILPIISPRWQRERGMGEKNRICRLNRGYERRGGREKRAKGGLDEALSCIERCTRKWEAVSRRPWGLREKHFTRKDHPCRVTAGLITGGGRSGEANARNRER